MQYLKIQTIVSSQKMIDEWIENRLTKEAGLMLKKGKEVVIKREEGAVTEYRLIEAD